MRLSEVQKCSENSGRRRSLTLQVTQGPQGASGVQKGQKQTQMPNRRQGPEREATNWVQEPRAMALKVPTPEFRVKQSQVLWRKQPAPQNLRQKAGPL